MKLFVCPNLHTPQQVQTAAVCIELLRHRLGAEIGMTADAADVLYGDRTRAAFPPEACDLVVSLGGDGAVLRAAQIAVSCGRSLLGINGGRLGYLCALEARDIETVTPDTLAALKHSPRAMLRIETAETSRLALNDLVVKSGLGGTVDLEIGRDGKHLVRWRGDGAIISTPTGSTSYNLSVGGPIVTDGVPALILAPICAHAMDVRALVVPDDALLSVSMVRGDEDEAYAYADGVNLGRLGAGQVTVRRAEQTLDLLIGDDPLNKLRANREF